jgi:hypothetical protein
MENVIFTGPSKKRKRLVRKHAMAVKAEGINRVLTKAIEAVQSSELGSLVELVARKMGRGSATVRYVVPAVGKLPKVRIDMVDWIARKHGGAMDQKDIAIINGEERITLAFTFPSKRDADAFKRDVRVPFKHHDLKAVIERLEREGATL